jgi:hypothetical protein
MKRCFLPVLILTAVLEAACNGGSNSPTSPTRTPAPTVTAPPAATITPPPPVQPTPYSGRWSGQYVIDRCDGTGSVQDLLCGTRRGLFPPGTSLPIAIDLTQNGTTVSGTIALGAITGVVSGAVRSNGL